jgi:centromere/kinetochore protein ZW10
VTVSVQTLVAMVHETMNEACTASADCTSVLIHTARDILNLFRALVPTLHAEKLENDPRLAALFHNDCIYIAHHMLTIGHQYRDRLPTPSASSSSSCSSSLPPPQLFIGMVDLVPSFRQLASRVLTSQVNRQKARLAGILAADMPTYCTEVAGASVHAAAAAGGGISISDATFVVMESCLKRLLFDVSDLGAMWRSILPTSLYHAIIGQVLDEAVLTTLIVRLQELQQHATTLATSASSASSAAAQSLGLPTETSHQLFYLHSLVLQPVVATTVARSSTSNGGDGPATGLFDSEATAVKNSKLWTKFTEMTLALDA